MSNNSASRRTVVINSAQDVIRAVNEGVAKGGRSGAITIVALGGVFIDAYDFTSISFGLKGITKDYHLSPVVEGLVAASIMIGAIVGAFVGGHLVDRLGRYKIFMTDMLFFVVAALVAAVAWNPWVLIGARFVMGLGVGMDFPVALAFVAEFTAMRGKGTRITLWQPMWYMATSIGFLILVPLYFIVPPSSDLLWRVAVGFGAVPALVVMLVRHRYMDESPAWAAQQGDLDQAATILRKSYGVDAVVAQDADRTRSVTPKASFSDVRKLFTQRYRNRTFLAGSVNFCQTLEYYAVGFALPGILTGLLGQGKLTSIVGPLVFNAAFGVTGGFLGARLTAHWGSWRLSTIGFGGVLIALLLLGVIGQPASVGLLIFVGVLLATFVFFHSGGPGAQGMTMATLSYPTSLRGIGTGFSQAVLRVGSTISLIVFPILTSRFGTEVFFFVAIAPALGLIALGLVRWNPVGVDVDRDDAGGPLAASEPPSRTRPHRPATTS